MTEPIFILIIAIVVSFGGDWYFSGPEEAWGPEHG